MPIGDTRAHRDGTVARARAAYQQRDWVAARDGFAAVRDGAVTDGDHGSLDATDLYALADCCWWLGDLDTALPLMHEAYQRHLDDDRAAAAAMVAIDIGYTMSIRGDEAQGSGWIARATRLLQDQPESAEHGYLAYLDFESAFDASDLSTAMDMARRIHALGRRFADANLSALGVLGQGRVLVRQGEVARGMALLDEAMVAAVGDDLDPAWAGNIYCHLMAACDEIADLRRAGEWTQATAAWCQSMPGSGPFMGICRVHRARVLSARGAWDDAEREVRHVCEELASFDVVIAAEAHYLLGELKLQRGDLAAAERAFTEGHQLGRDPQPGIALLRLAHGDAEAAATSIRSTLATAGDDLAMRSRLLPAAVEVALAVGDLAWARACSEELTQVAHLHGTTGSASVALHARGAVLLADDDATAAVPVLRDALAAAREVELPLEGAQIRLLLARAHDALGDDDTARRERDAARRALAELGAPEQGAGDHGASGGAAGLTARELEVLSLVATGRSNQDIAAELVLSVRTVERHLASIYQKLGLQGRSARAGAVSYAHREGILAPS